MRLSVIVLIVVIAVGSSVVILGYLTNQEYVEIFELSDQYVKLENYKTELEKINQYNQEILEDLQNQIKNSDDSSLEQIREEIDIIDLLHN